MRRIDHTTRPCSTCGAAAGQPCRQVGPGIRVSKIPYADLRQDMVTVHAARRRTNPSHADSTRVALERERALLAIDRELSAKVFNHHPHATTNQLATALGLEHPGFIESSDDDYWDGP